VRISTRPIASNASNMRRLGARSIYALQAHLPETVFPGENCAAELGRAGLSQAHYNTLDKGGHYAAWEQPQLFSEEVHAGFRPLRT